MITGHFIGQVFAKQEWNKDINEALEKRIHLPINSFPQ
jgi:hypothetical protein